MKDDRVDEKIFMLLYAEITQCSEVRACSVSIFVSDKAVLPDTPIAGPRAGSTARETIRERKRKT